MKLFWENNDIYMYSTHKSAVAERFIRVLRNNLYKYMTSMSKSVDIVHEYGHTYHSKINMKPIDVKSNTYIDSNKEIDKKYPKFKISDTVRISKYKNVFAKGDSQLV